MKIDIDTMIFRLVRDQVRQHRHQSGAPVEQHGHDQYRPDAHRADQRASRRRDHLRQRSALPHRQ